MIDDFLLWSWDRLQDFGDWFKWTIGRAFELLEIVLGGILLTLLIVLLFPIWILPFIYWFAFVRNKKGDRK